MKKKRVFLEKHLKDRRFRKNEDAILNGYSDEHKHGVTVRELAKKIGIARATIYIHHHSVNEIIPDHKRYILSKYSREINKKMKQKNASLKNIYLDTLLFVLKNKQVFAVFIKCDEREVFVELVGKLEPKIISVTRLPKNSEKIFKIYKSEIATIIVRWGEHNFPKDEINSVLTDIMYLTETMRSRLMPINRE